ncbi:ABC transporter substrate-binding protein [Micromonospora sp. URMC 105]|uniref:ABC transporter substrate-binding protein n=1 Tax=Micromonospora sp. URMC 105 TaxID=3423413 RepID=UPI003F1D4A16
MRPPLRTRLAVVGVVVLVVTAGCTSTAPEDEEGPAGAGTGQQSSFFVQADYDEQIAQRAGTPTGPADQPWLQAINPQLTDTAKFKKSGRHTICFSNAGVNNPWRVVGWTTMQAEAKLHPEIAALTAVDAEGKDDKQISDIDGLLASRKCSALIVSPNTTAALTPAVEKACQTGLPVIVFDRGVNTDCPVTFIHPIGGYAFGATAAEFLTDKVKKNGRILALRILPGVDVLETRWSAAKVVFDKADVNVVGVEFTDGDAAKVKTIVNDYLERYGSIDGVWMDAGATSVAAVEAFEDAGQPAPVITGEDQQDFLRLWQEKKLTAIAPTYPTYQWRTPIQAALDILAGKQVPKEWVLPQPTITQDNLGQYVLPQLPPLHYALCGCEKMPGFPQNWGGNQ